MNPYEVLGVATSATPAEVKTAYRKMAKQHHPDQHGGSEDAKRKFQEIQAAYDMLRDDKPQQQRQQHNQHQQSNSGWSFHFGGGDPSQMFEEMMRQHHEAMRRATPMYQAYIEITLEEALTGVQRDFTLPNMETIKIDVPAGIDHGQAFVLADAVPAHDGMQAGSLQIVIRLHRHTTFGRQGSDLITKVEIDILDAILGCEKEITTLSGEKVRIKLAPNTKPDTVVRISQHGMPVMHSSTRGDLHAHVMVVFREFTEEQRKVLEQLR